MSFTAAQKSSAARAGRPRRSQVRAWVVAAAGLLAVGAAAAAVMIAGAGGQDDPSPTDTAWLIDLVGDGMIACSSESRIYVTDLRTGRTELVGSGSQPEFSPDGAKLAWIDGTDVRGRERAGGPVRLIARGIDPAGGVHWIASDEIVALRRDGWHRIRLDGSSRLCRDLTALGRGGHEIDVKLDADGVWFRVTGSAWQASDGRSGSTGGTCSSSLSRDARWTTGLVDPHQECHLRPTFSGAVPRVLRWQFASPSGKGFDNHRWSSNDPRFLICEDELHHQMVIIEPATERCARIGPAGGGEMYADFTAGPADPDAPAWPEPSEALAAGARSQAWPVSEDGLAFRWVDMTASNSIPAPGGGTSICHIERVGRATVGLGSALHLWGGRAAAAIPALAPNAEGGSLSLEIAVTPANVSSPTPTVIAELTDGGRRALLRIVQDRARIAIQFDPEGSEALASSDPVASFAVEPNRRHCLAVVWRGDAHERPLVCFLDGHPLSWNYQPDGALAALRSPQLALGGGKSPWHGHVGRIAVFTRALARDEVAASYSAIRAADSAASAPETIRAEAELVRKYPIPKPENYPDALVAFHYRAATSDDPSLEPGEEFIAMRWAVAGGETVSEAAGAREGARAALTLHLFLDRPDLHAVQSVTADDQLDLPLFFAAP